MSRTIVLARSPLAAIDWSSPLQRLRAGGAPIALGGPGGVGAWVEVDRWASEGEETVSQISDWEDEIAAEQAREERRANEGILGWSEEQWERSTRKFEQGR